MINPIPGQEEENAEFLEKSNVAVWVKNEKNFEKDLKYIIQDDILDKLKENVKKIAKPNAAEEICKIIFEDYI